MSIHKIENLGKELETQTKSNNIKLNDIQSTFVDKLKNIQEINIDDGETKEVVKAKLFLDINKDTAKLASRIEDIKIKLKYLEKYYIKIIRKDKIFWMLPS